MRISSFPLLTSGLLLLAMTLSSVGPLCAAPASERDPRSAKDSISRAKDRKEKGKKAEEKKETADQEKGESLFLPETAENQTHVTELYRCPDCGYEQDEAGFCPDHDEQALTLVLSQGRNPLEPAEVDGNEDLLVDLPLSGLQFKTGAGASGTVPLPGVKKSGEQAVPRPPPNTK